MAGVISAEEDALNKGARAVAEAHGSIKQQVSKVRSEVEQLGGAWQGAAAVSFRNLMSEWNGKAERLSQVLDQLQQNLVTTDKVQQELEQEHNDSIRNLGSLMSGI
ncbi:WXG100 family type VII secretion target [Lysinibacter cavernae]|uniref:ESAT-6-like protein n=1 Tax=Lysinibacter cavernae TaxID=1640652 RepID=A0A7X5TU46_9MICO|nr:WXG100 family type VII secretion target [Lysinibacter cavernae]NIH53993.1 WXG100 family type VII secretion target [Lysinibacter cavernae]